MSLPFTAHLQPLLSARAMQHADAHAINALGLPGMVLMETAGRGAARTIEKTVATLEKLPVTLFCGPGNNGGDGFVVARVLASKGADVQVFVLDETRLSGDARRHYDALCACRPFYENRLRIDPYENLIQVAATRRAHVLVDALLGTGLNGPLRAPYDALVDWINAQDALRVALDIPTGIHADTGEVLGAALQADLTVTMAARKPGLVVGAGVTHAGKVVVVDIGTPPGLLRQMLEDHSGAYRTTDRWMRAHLPRRAPDANKYSAGLVLALAGSPGLTGAPVMASLAAARAGAGYVMCACPASIQSTLATHFVEVATLALPHDAHGLDAKGTLQVLAEKLPKAKALLVGPGLGRAPGTQRTVRDVLMAFDGPTVIDADGLAALTPDFIALHARQQWVLTPHAGEFERLAGHKPASDRIAAVRTYAQAWNCVLVLKGMPSVVGLPDGRVIVGGAGNAALATAGTGDVLAGMTAGFLAQGATPAAAALCALHAGGRAAERWSRTHGIATLQATDLLRFLSRLLIPS